MLRSGRARAGPHEARTLWSPVDSLDCSPQRRRRPLERPPLLSNSNKGEPGPRGRRLAPARRVSGQHGRAAPATGKCPDSCCSVYLKALFLRLQKTQPQKSIRAIKKRHKLASPRLRETEADAPGSHCGSVRFCLQRFVCSAPAADRQGPRGRARAVENFLLKKKELQDELSGLHGDCGIVGPNRT